MKKHATTIVLVLVGALLALYWWADRERITADEKHRRENNVFTAWRREQLSRLEIGHAAGDGEKIVLERDAKADGPWRLASPRQEKADQQAVEKLLSTLELALVQRKASEGGALGFETPRAAGSITMGGLVHRFVLGAASPRPEGSSYFRLDDDPPVVVSRDLTRTLLQDADAYRDRTVVPYLSLELAELAVTYEGGALTLEHVSGRWFRVAQAGVVASRAGTEKIWAALAELRAEVFPKDADADALTKTPALTLRLVPRDGRPPGELVFGGPCPGHPDDVVVLRRKPTRVAACAPKGVLEALRTPPASLVETRPFFLEADEIEEIRFESVKDAGAGAPTRVDLARKASGWRLRAPGDRDLSESEAEAVSELVSRLASSPARGPRRSPKEEPIDLVARAVVHAGDHEEVVEVGRFDPATGTAPVRRQFDMARLEAPAALARRLMPRETIWRSRAVLEGETRRVTRVLLRCGAGTASPGTPQELVDKGEGLRLVEPPGFETDGSVVSLVEAFAKGKVDRWVADEDDGSFGLGASTCKVVLGFEDGNAPRTIVLGAEGDGGIFGAVSGRPGVFVAPLGLRDLASAIYVSRASLRADPKTVAGVRVTKQPAGAPGLPPEVALEAAAALYADRVLAVGPETARRVTDADVVLEVQVTGEKAPRTIRCAPSKEAPSRHVCVRAGLAAAFLVDDAKLAPFTGALKTPADAGPRDASR